MKWFLPLSVDSNDAFVDAYAPVCENIFFFMPDFFLFLPHKLSRVLSDFLSTTPTCPREHLLDGKSHWLAR